MTCFRYPAILTAAVAGILMSAATRAQPPQSPDEGLRIFKSANCVGCHKWSGEGGGGYGGAAANLRATSLTTEQIEETIRCGRPMTGMPHFEEEAYSDGRCYGMKQGDLAANQMPPEPDHPLRPADIRAVATYVVTYVKGKGPPNFAQCQAFFGSGSRVCGVYAKPEEATSQTASAPSGSGGPTSTDAPSHAHVKVETAADANAAAATGK